MHKSKSLEYELSSESLHISAKQLLLNAQKRPNKSCGCSSGDGRASLRDSHAPQRGASSTERRGNNFKTNQHFGLKARARIWPCLSCMCHVRSTAARAEFARPPTRCNEIPPTSSSSLLLSSLYLSDTKIYEPEIRVRLGTAAHFEVPPLPREEGTNSHSFACKSRPESGLACLVCAEFATLRSLLPTHEGLMCNRHIILICVW